MVNWIINKILKVNLFELGISATLYYLLIFFLKPLLFILGVPLRYAFSGIEQGVDYRAIFYLAIGFASLLLGYYVPIAKIIVNYFPKSLVAEWDFQKAPWVFTALFSLGIGIKFLRILSGTYLQLTMSPLQLKMSTWLISSPFYSLVGLLDWLGYIALIIAFVSCYNLKKINDSHYKTWRYVAWGTLIFEIIYAIPSCSRLAIITPLIIYLIIRSYFCKTIYRQILIITIGILFIVFPLGNICRNQAVLNNFTDSKTKSLGIFRANEFVADSFITRADQFNVFSKILTTTTSQTEFINGKSFMKFFVSLGPPRFIWKNKPTITIDYNAFGKRIGVIGQDNNTTAVGPTLIGEWYMSFGIIGIIIGMMFMGLLWRTIYLYLTEKTNFMFTGIMIYVVVWIHAVKGLEDTFAPVYAGLVKIVIILCLIYFCLRKRELNV